jgi:pathogenesis-related protein 1
MIGMRSDSRCPSAPARRAAAWANGVALALGIGGALGCGVDDLLDGNAEPPASVSGGGVEQGVFVGVTEAHNTARQELGASPALGDLEWSDELAAFAQQWSDDLARRCGTIEHRDQNRFGENIALRGSSRPAGSFSGAEAVEGWVAEDACWDYGTIRGSERCDAACIQGLNSNGCGHYTQVVWRGTRFVGCGYSTCQSQDFTYEVWVCNYDPPGNYVGQTPY